MNPQLRFYLPLALHIVPTTVIAYGLVIPNGPIAGINDHTIGFATTLIGTIATYHAGIRLARALPGANPRQGGTQCPQCE